MIKKFRETLLEMLETGELKKVYKYASLLEKPKVKHDIKLIEKHAKYPGNSIPLLMNLKSVEVFRGAIACMKE